MIFVTGGAGFIGANFVLDWLAHVNEPVVNIDKLTYAGNLENLASLQGDAHMCLCSRYRRWCQLAQLLAEHQPRAVVNCGRVACGPLIHGPEDFIQTNVVGTFRLLEAVRAYWNGLEGEGKVGLPLSACLHQTRSMARCRQLSQLLPKSIITSPTARTRPARRLRTIWCEPGILRTSGADDQLQQLRSAAFPENSFLWSLSMR